LVLTALLRRLQIYQQTIDTLPSDGPLENITYEKTKPMQSSTEALTDDFLQHKTQVAAGCKILTQYIKHCL